MLNLFCSYFNFLSKKAVLKAGFSVNSTIQTKVENVISKSEVNSKQNDWYLEIPNINLKAYIAEGTTKEIMDEFVGHFEETERWKGNVCLAAHNRGYKNNYFSELKRLQKGEKIIYTFENASREYLVEKNSIIQATDLTCLESTEDNILTLITCVENEPNYRRCIKATQNIK